MTPEQTELSNYLNQLIESTRKGSIEWNKANPTTYVWEIHRPKPARLTLQQVEKRVVKRSPTGARVGPVEIKKGYMLQLLDKTAGGQARLSVDGLSNESANEVLGQLYEVIGDGITRQGLDFLKSVIP